MIVARLSNEMTTNFKQTNRPSSWQHQDPRRERQAARKYQASKLEAKGKSPCKLVAMLIVEPRIFMSIVAFLLIAAANGKFERPVEMQQAPG